MPKQKSGLRARLHCPGTSSEGGVPSPEPFAQQLDGQEKPCAAVGRRQKVSALGQDGHGDDGADTGYGLEQTIVWVRAERGFGLLLELLALVGQFLVTLELQLKGLTGQRVMGNGQANTVLSRLIQL